MTAITSPEAIGRTALLMFLRSRLNGHDMKIADIVTRLTGNPLHPVRDVLIGAQHELDQAEADPALNLGVIIQLAIEDAERRLAELATERTPE